MSAPGHACTIGAVPRLHTANRLRNADPIILVCSGCDGLLVPRVEEIAPSCSTCEATLCELCAETLAACRAKNPRGFAVKPPPAVTKERLEDLAELLGLITRGLKGKPFELMEEKWAPARAKLRAFGVSVVTPDQIERLGHRLRKDADAVGRVIFDSALKGEERLFLFGVQTVPRELPGSAPASPQKSAPAGGSKPPAGRPNNQNRGNER